MFIRHSQRFKEFVINACLFPTKFSSHDRFSTVFQTISNPYDLRQQLGISEATNLLDHSMTTVSRHLSVPGRSARTDTLVLLFRSLTKVTK